MLPPHVHRLLALSIVVVLSLALPLASALDRPSKRIESGQPIPVIDECKTGPWPFQTAPPVEVCPDGSVAINAGCSAGIIPPDAERKVDDAVNVTRHLVYRVFTAVGEEQPPEIIILP